jgi:DNA-binding NarL/FixJ family response regulator
MSDRAVATMLSVMLIAAGQLSASVVIAMRHPAMRSSLWAVVQGDSGLRPLGAAADVRDTMRLLHYAQPEVVLVDSAILGERDLQRLPTLRAAAPDAVFIVLGMGDHPAYAVHARKAGAFDYIRFDEAAERLPETIRAAQR